MDHPRGWAGLLELMNVLRGPGGCPWDREQDYGSLRSYLLEESFEVAEAIDRGDRDQLREELGDLLFQIVFLARLAEEQGRFTIHDVVDGIADKLVRRHPHVFGSAVATTADQVARNWEEIKRGEKGGQRALLDSVPRALPALLAAQRLGDKAAQVGFDWPDASAVLAKIQEEASELREALAGPEPDAVRHEFGDLLFSLAMLARHLRLDAEAALAGANRRFRSRFGWVEQELARRGERPEGASFARLEQLWQEAKTRAAD